MISWSACCPAWSSCFSLTRLNCADAGAAAKAVNAANITNMFECLFILRSSLLARAVPNKERHVARIVPVATIQLTAKGGSSLTRILAFDTMTDDRITVREVTRIGCKGEPRAISMPRLILLGGPPGVGK